MIRLSEDQAATILVDGLRSVQELLRPEVRMAPETAEFVGGYLLAQLITAASLEARRPQRATPGADRSDWPR